MLQANAVAGKASPLADSALDGNAPETSQQPNTHLRLTQGNITRHLIRLSVPPMIALFSIFSYNIADTYFVAKLGIEPLAAISFATPLSFVFITIFVALGIGVTSVVSIHLGKKGIDSVRLIARDAMLLASLMAVVLILVGLATLNIIFPALGAEGNILELCKTYMRIWYFCMFFTSLHICASNIIRSVTGNSIAPSLFMIASSFINIILDPIFIFGWGFVPAMGIAGSAWATLIASAFSFLVRFG